MPSTEEGPDCAWGRGGGGRGTSTMGSSEAAPAHSQNSKVASSLPLRVSAAMMTGTAVKHAPLPLCPHLEAHGGQA